MHEEFSSPALAVFDLLSGLSVVLSQCGYFFRFQCYFFPIQLTDSSHNPLALETYLCYDFNSLDDDLQVDCDMSFIINVPEQWADSEGI